MRRRCVTWLSVLTLLIASMFPVHPVSAVTVKDVEHLVMSVLADCVQKNEEIKIGTKDNMHIKVTLDCGAPVIPANVKVTWMKAHVNSPTKPEVWTTEKKFCKLSNPCVLEFQSPKITQTMHVLAKLESLAYGPKEDLTGEACCLRRTYNDKGAPYPHVRSTRGGEEYVPFPTYTPGYGWTKCKDDIKVATPPACPRPDGFPEKVRKYYESKGWSIPKSPTEAHHIQPLRWGGGNDASNGVLLDEFYHKPFTTWWASFSDKPWLK